MGDVEEVLDHHQRVGAALVQRFHAVERTAGIALQHGLEQVEDQTAVGDAEHVAHHRLADRPCRERDRLIQDRQPVPHRPVGGAGNEAERRRVDFYSLRRGDPLIMRDELVDRHPAQREPLAARQHCHRHLLDFGGGEDEFDIGRRFFERLQQRVEGVLRQHVDFVDDVDLEPRRDRAVAHPLGQLADVVDPGARGRVHLDHVDMAVLGDRGAMLTGAAGRNGRPAAAVGADAVERAGDDPRRRRLADPAHPGEDKGVRHPAARNRVREGADHRLLADQFGKGLWPVLAGQHAIMGRGVGHRRR